MPSAFANRIKRLVRQAEVELDMSGAKRRIGSGYLNSLTDDELDNLLVSMGDPDARRMSGQEALAVYRELLNREPDADRLPLYVRA